MRADLLVAVPLVLTALGVGIALLAQWALLRPAKPASAVGVITARDYKPASTYVQHPTGLRSGFWRPTRIPLTECHVFRLRVEGLPGEARLALGTQAAQDFEVGQTVRVEYVERGLPLFGKRLLLVDMKPL
jgi:hypothetical protein